MWFLSLSEEALMTNAALLDRTKATNALPMMVIQYSTVQ